MFLLNFIADQFLNKSNGNLSAGIIRVQQFFLFGLASIVFTFTGCTSKTPQDAAHLAEGKWIYEFSNGNTVMDKWEMDSDTLFGYRKFTSVVLNDTSLQEVFKVYRDKGLTLEVADKESVNPYVLKLENTTDTSMTFTNKTYAYPKEITFIRTDSLIFKATGEHGVIPKTVVYRFGKMQRLPE